VDDLLASLQTDLSVAKILAAVSIALLIWILVKTKDIILDTILALIPQKPLLVYVSTGGTCRDPMAKVITEKALGERSNRIKIIAVGTGEGSMPGASRGARIVVEEAYDKDLLENHKTKVISRAIVNKASLILCMSQHHVADLYKRYPSHRGKITSLCDFVGEKNEEIENPYYAPNEISHESLLRYRNCFTQLRRVIEGNLDLIFKATLRSGEIVS